MVSDMTVGIAIYGVAPGQSSLALSLGLSLFDTLGLKVSSATTPRLLVGGDHPGDHEVVDVTLAELQDQIELGNVAAFAIFNEDGAHLPWRAAFHHSIDGFGSFPHLSIQVPEDKIGPPEAWGDRLSPIFQGLKFMYAIGYRAENASSAWNYCLGNGTTKVDERENNVKFAREIPQTRGGLGRYAGSMLRMVYPLNVLNNEHCKIMVDGVPLEELIRSSSDMGKLTELSNGLKLWILRDSQLSNANAKLGGSGCLIAWQESNLRTTRRLP